MRCFVLLAVAGALSRALPGADPAQLAYDARQAEKKGELTRAYALYAQAAAFAPENKKYAGKVISLQRAALESARVVVGSGATPPLASTEFLSKLDPSDLAEVKRLQPPPRLIVKPGQQAFAFNGRTREVWQDALTKCGLDSIFDSEFQEARDVQFRLDSATCSEMIRAMETVTGAFMVPITSKMVLVAKDTQPKRLEQERTVAITIDLPEPYTVQDFQEMARAVQQAFELQKFAIDPTRRVALMRDRWHKVQGAKILFEQLMMRRPEVMLDIEFIELAKKRDTSMGLSLPTSLNFSYLGGVLNSRPSVSSALSLWTFGGGLSMMGVAAVGAGVFGSLTSTRAESIYHAGMRSLDNLPATLHIGDKFPIQTQAFIGDTSGANAGGTNVFRPPPQIQFEDLGLSLKITPRVHGTEEVTLAIESEFKVLTGESLNGIPVISNRKVQCQVRLKQGEWAIVSGLVTSNETKSFSGIAGLAQIPGLGAALRKNDRQKSEGQTLLVLRPRIVGFGASEYVARDIWVGTETRPLPAI